MLAHPRPRFTPASRLLILSASMLGLMIAPVSRAMSAPKRPPAAREASPAAREASPAAREASPALRGASSAAPEARPAGDFVPVHVAGIRMVGPDQVLLLLADEKEERAMPMAVGRDQGVAIYLGKEHAATPRPLTHDLLVRILKALGAVVEKVTVTGLKQDTYFAEITLRSGKEVHTIDARPSDALALALRLEAPAFAAAGLLRAIPAAAGPSGIPTRSDRRLGFTVQHLDPELAESIGAADIRGVLVASVKPDGPAAIAGLRRGDVLEAIDGMAVSDLESFGRAAAAAVEKPGFRIWREGASRNLSTP